METIVIDGQNIIQGIGLNEWSQDGGYSPRTKGINPFKEKGVINFQPIISTITGLEGNVVASIVDPNPLNNDAYILDDEGKFYTLVGTTLTKQQTDVTKTYQAGTSDIVWFKGALFATSQTDITMITGADLETAIDPVWWSTTLGNGNLNTGYRHPMEVVEDTLYIADQNKLHSWDGVADVKDALTLPEIYNITAMHIHPNGRDLILFCSDNVNYSGSRQIRGIAFIVNTATLEFSQSIELDDMVTGARIVGGILYTTYGRNKLGYFSDTGLVFLRELIIPSTAGGDEIAYKHHLGNLSGHLLVIEDKTILAFGDLGAGKVFWYPLANQPRNLDNVLSLGSNSILFGSETTGGVETLSKIDLDDVTASGVFYSSRYSFPKRVWIRRMEIEHTAFTIADEFIEAGYITPFGSVVLARQASYSTDGASTHSRFDLNANGDQFMFYASTSGSVTIKKITIYYEYGED